MDGIAPNGNKGPRARRRLSAAAAAAAGHDEHAVAGIGSEQQQRQQPMRLATVSHTHWPVWWHQSQHQAASD